MLLVRCCPPEFHMRFRRQDQTTGSSGCRRLPTTLPVAFCESALVDVFFSACEFLCGCFWVTCWSMLCWVGVFLKCCIDFRRILSDERSNMFFTRKIPCKGVSHRKQHHGNGGTESGNGFQPSPGSHLSSRCWQLSSWSGRCHNCGMSHCACVVQINFASP